MKSIKIATLIIISAIIGFLIGRYLVLYITAHHSGIAALHCCYILTIIFGGIALLYLTAYFIFKKYEKIKTIPLWPFFIPFTIGSLIILTFYIRYGETDVNTQDFKNKYAIWRHKEGRSVGVISEWGDIIINNNKNEWYTARVFDNNTHQDLFLALSSPTNKNIRNFKEWEGKTPVTLNAYNSDGHLIQSFSFKYNSQSNYHIKDFIIDKYENFLNDGFCGLSMPIDKPSGQTHANNNDHSENNISGNSTEESSNTYTPENESRRREPERHETSVPVQVWHQCMNCLGSGQCPYCYGQGHIISVYGDQDCPVCTNGNCTMCAGHGGHNETEYQTRVDYY